MYKPFVRALAVVSASLALLPGQTQACWLTNCFKCCKPKPTTYCAPACDPCPQQVNYVPQTCYRTVTQCVPCTTMKPECSIDPCTGCPTTVMRPVTTMVQRTVQVPYTTFRPVVTPVSMPASPCATGACGGATNYYTPSSAAMPVGLPVGMNQPGCTNCAQGATYAAPAATYSTPAPAATYGAPAAAPSYTTPTYTTPGSTMPAPSLSSPPMGSPTPAAPSIAPMSTYQNGTLAPPATNTLRPVPDVQQYSDPKVNSSSAPRLLDPNNRTTARPMHRTAVLPAIFQMPERNVIQPVSQQSDSADNWAAAPRADEGWRPMGGR